MSKREEESIQALRALSKIVVRSDPQFKQRLIATLLEEQRTQRRGLLFRIYRDWSHTHGMRWALASLLMLILIFTLLPHTPNQVVLTVNRGSAQVVSASTLSTLWKSEPQSYIIDDRKHIIEGTTITLQEDSTAVLSLFNESRVELAPGTQMTLTKAQPRSALQAAAVQMQVKSGEVRAYVEHLQSPNERFEVAMPSALITVRGTVFRARIISPQHTYVATDDGVVVVTLNDANLGYPSVSVHAGYEVDAIIGQALVVRSQRVLTQSEVIEQPPASLYFPELATVEPEPPNEESPPTATLTPSPSPTSPPQSDKMLSTPSVSETLVALSPTPSIVTATTTLTQTTNITHTEQDPSSLPDEYPEEEPLPTYPPAETDLRLIWIATAEPVAAESEVRYALELRNNGPSKAHNVVVTYMLPPEVNVLTADPVPQNNTLPIIWNLGALASGESRILRTRVQIQPWVTQSFTTTAVVQSLTKDANLRNNRVDHMTRISTVADLAVTDVKIRSIVGVGSIITYDVAYANHGPAIAQNLTLTVKLSPMIDFGGTVYSDPPMTFIPAIQVPKLGTLLLGDTQAPGWTVPSLATGMKGQVIFTATVRQDALGVAGGELRLASSTPDDSLDNNTYMVSTTITNTADLALSLVKVPTPVMAGGVLTYTLVYTNYGPRASQNVSITHTLPPDVHFGRQLGALPVLTPTTHPTGTLTWNMPSLAPGITGTLVYTALIGKTPAFTLTDGVVIQSDTLDEAVGNNQVSITTKVLVPSLLVRTVVTPNIVVPYMPFTYVLHITNTGTLTFPINALTITNFLPQQTHVISLSKRPSIFSPPILVWKNSQPLTPTQSLSMSLVVSSTRNLSLTQLINTTFVTAVLDANTVSITDSVPVSITGPSLAVSQQVAQVFSQMITFTVHLSNTGPSTVDILPVTDNYDSDHLRLVKAYPVPRYTENGQLIWTDLTEAPPYGFGQNLHPGDVFDLVTIFTRTQTIPSHSTLQNRVTITEVADIYHNVPPKGIEAIYYALRYSYLPLVTRR